MSSALKAQDRIILGDQEIFDFIGKKPEDINSSLSKLRKKEVEKVVEISIHDGSELKSLNGIEKCKNLNRVQLNDFSMKSLGKIDKLEKLEYVILSNFSIDVFDFQELPASIEYLSIYRGSINTWLNIKKMKKLKYLMLDYSKIRNLNLNEIPESVKVFSFQGQGIDSLKSVEPLFSHVLELIVCDNNVSDINNIKNWGTVEKINLFNNPIMANFKNLEDEKLFTNKIRIVFEDPKS